MSPNTKSLIAGFTATAVLSGLMLMKSALGLMPQLDVIRMLANMMNSSTGVAWLIHFMLGTLGYGMIFAFASRYKNVLPYSPVAKAVVIASAGWLMMMLAVMPMAGAGLFGMNLGVMAPVMTLALHIIFGLVLGAVFAALGRKRSENMSSVTLNTH